jgi:fluoride exporter
MRATILWLGLAGAAGALSRYWLGGAVARWTGAAFPWGTLAVNALGCLLFGFFWSLAEERMLIGAAARTVILIGFMGAFTTFSSFAFETVELLRDSQYLRALGNVAAQNVSGVILLYAGIVLGRVV